MTTRWIWAGCAVAVSASLCWLLLTARDLVQAQRGVATREAALTREMAAREIAATRAALVAEVHGLRGDVSAQVAAIAGRADAQLTGTRADAMAAIGQALVRVDRVATVLEQVQTSAQPVIEGAGRIVTEAERDLRDARPAVEAAVRPEEVAGVVRDTRLLLARSARTVGHVEQMADAVEKETAPTAAAVRGMAVDVGGAVHEAVAPKPWYRKIPDYLNAGAKIVLFLVR